MELYIGPGREWDINSWMELVEQVKDGFPGLETREAMEAHRKTVLDFMAKGEAICARDGASIVGALLCSKEENQLCFLAVGEAYRRQHVAQRMVDYMKTILDAQRGIVVTTYRDGVPEGMAARAFYQRMGFVEGALTEEFHSPVQEFVYREPYPIHRLGDAEQVSDGLRYTPMQVEERLRLVRPVARYAEQVMAYREAMLKRGDELDGCGVLENEVPDTVGLCSGGTIQRYWIALSETGGDR